MKTTVWLLIAFFLFLGLPACSDESRDFTWYEPGTYKGAQDPLLTKDLHEELNNRLKTGQTDR
jgi:hypothetical protein